MHIESHSESETFQAAAQLLDQYGEAWKRGPLFISLSGDMGVGKTRFAKGLAQALGFSGVVVSPSYVLSREYHGSEGLLVHIDCWRTPTITPDELDLTSYLRPGVVIAVEWPAPLRAFESVVAQHGGVAVEVSMREDGEKRVISWS